MGKLLEVTDLSISFGGIKAVQKNVSGGLEMFFTILSILSNRSERQP